MDASFWGPMWRALDRDVRLLTPEFPGFGAAPPVDAPSIAGFAAHVAELIARQDAGPATVVGLSLGGYVALALAEEDPATVAALVLANTRAAADTDDARAGRDAAVDVVKFDGLDAFLETLLPRLLGPAAGGEAWERARAIAGRQDPEAVVGALEALRDRPDRSGVLGDLDVPVVVVTGCDDAVTPPEEARAFAAAIAGAAYVEIPAAGHLSALEQPEAFAEVVAGVLAARG